MMTKMMRKKKKQKKKKEKEKEEEEEDNDDCDDDDEQNGWLVVLGFNATLTAKVISWRSLTHMCFLAFSHQY